MTDHQIAPPPSPAVLQWAHRLYWLLLFIVFPLSFHPYLLLRGWLPLERLAELPANPVLLTRALLLGILLALGVALLFATYNHSNLSDLPRLLTRQPLPHLAALLLALLVLLSTFFSNAAPDMVAFGADNRLDGTLVVSAWFLLAVVSSALMRSGIVAERWFRRVLLASGVLTGLYVLAQAVGIEPLNLLPGPRVSLGHPEGPFGHGGRTSAYLGMVLIVVVASTLRAGRIHTLQVLAAMVMLAGMFAAGGRAGILAFVLVWIVLGVLIARQPGRRGLRAFLVITALSAVVGSVAAFGTEWGRGKIAGLQDAIEGEDPSLNHRLIFWRAGTDVLLENPLWGVGPSGFAFTLYDHVSERETAELLSEFLGYVPDPGSYIIEGEALVYRDRNSGEVAAQRIRMSRTHNYLLDTGLANGIPSLLVFAAFVLLSLRTLLTSRSGFAFGIGLALLLFMVFGLAWFSSVSMDPVVWGLVGIGLGAAHLARDRAAESAREPEASPTEQPAVVAPGVLTAEQ